MDKNQDYYLRNHIQSNSSYQEPIQEQIYQFQELQLNKEMEVQKIKMLVMMENINDNTTKSFNETKEILQNFNNNQTLCGNAMNKLSSIINLASNFFQLTEREIYQNSSKEQAIILSNIYICKLEEILKNNIKFLEDIGKIKKLKTYSSYYTNVLSRQFPNQLLNQVETNGINSTEGNKIQLQNLMNNFVEATCITEKMMKKIEKDPIANKNIKYNDELIKHNIKKTSK